MLRMESGLHGESGWSGEGNQRPEICQCISNTDWLKGEFLD